MNWDNYNKWIEFILSTRYKDNLIERAGEECNKLIFYKNKKGLEDKKTINKEVWKEYGKLNIIFDKLNKKYKLNLGLPRQICENTQKHKKMDDIIIGKMYNIPAEINGIETNSNEYFYVPIHQSRRHIHGVPKEFLYDYVVNMIDKANWESRYYWYYTEPIYEDKCAIYMCPEKYDIVNVTKDNKKIKKECVCRYKINVFNVMKTVFVYLNPVEIKKLKNYFHKKKIDNYRNNFPSKSKYISYCIGNCIGSFGIIHKGIPSGKQKCTECNIIYCRECGKKPYHYSSLCKFTDIEFENPEMYRKCPGCKIWVEKEVGCDHIICLCGVHFCYNCRNVLNPNDPYFHVCRMGVTDPHFRDFEINHPTVRYVGEPVCKCSKCY